MTLQFIPATLDNLNSITIELINDSCFINPMFINYTTGDLAYKKPKLNLLWPNPEITMITGTAMIYLQAKLGVYSIIDINQSVTLYNASLIAASSGVNVSMQHNFSFSKLLSNKSLVHCNLAGQGTAVIYTKGVITEIMLTENEPFIDYNKVVVAYTGELQCVAKLLKFQHAKFTAKNVTSFQGNGTIFLNHQINKELYYLTQLPIKK